MDVGICLPDPASGESQGHPQGHAGTAFTFGIFSFSSHSLSKCKRSSSSVLSVAFQRPFTALAPPQGTRGTSRRISPLFRRLTARPNQQILPGNKTRVKCRWRADFELDREGRIVSHKEKIVEGCAPVASSRDWPRRCTLGLGGATGSVLCSVCEAAMLSPLRSSSAWRVFSSALKQSMQRIELPFTLSRAVTTSPGRSRDTRCSRLGGSLTPRRCGTLRCSDTPAAVPITTQCRRLAETTQRSI